MNDQTKATLDRILAEQYEATGLAGVAGVVRIGDGIWRGSAGVANLENKKPFVPTDFVRIASITKTYTATAVLQLVGEGKIALEDKLEKYVPGVINGTVATIADLLGMTSGIPDFTANEAFVKRFTADPTIGWSDAETLAVIAEAKRPDFAPGEKVVYCDSNYVLLGMIIAEVTGRPAREAITSKIIGPLGLSATSYPTTVGIPDPHPTSYVPAVTDPNTPFDNSAKPPRVVDERQSGRCLDRRGDDLDPGGPAEVGDRTRHGLAADAVASGPPAQDPPVRWPEDQLRVRSRDHQPE